MRAHRIQEEIRNGIKAQRDVITADLRNLERNVGELAGLIHLTGNYNGHRSIETRLTKVRKLLGEILEIEGEDRPRMRGPDDDAAEGGDDEG